MKQDFTFSRFVLSELNYTDDEIKQTVETLQKEDLSKLLHCPTVGKKCGM